VVVLLHTVNCLVAYCKRGTFAWQAVVVRLYTVNDIRLCGKLIVWLRTVNEERLCGNCGYQVAYCKRGTFTG